MKRIGIIGENFRNDACAFALLLTPQYKDKVTFVPVLKSLKTTPKKFSLNSVLPISRNSTMENEVSKNLSKTLKHVLTWQTKHK